MGDVSTLDVGVGGEDEARPGGEVRIGVERLGDRLGQHKVPVRRDEGLDLPGGLEEDEVLWHLFPGIRHEGGHELEVRPADEHHRVEVAVDGDLMDGLDEAFVLPVADFDDVGIVQERSKEAQEMVLNFMNGSGVRGEDDLVPLDEEEEQAVLFHRFGVEHRSRIRSSFRLHRQIVAQEVEVRLCEGRKAPRVDLDDLERGRPLDADVLVRPPTRR